MRYDQEWAVVRRSRSIPGGYRVVVTHLSEEVAQRRAQTYARPHEAMRMDVLIKHRLDALAELQGGQS